MQPKPEGYPIPMKCETCNANTCAFSVAGSPQCPECAHAADIRQSAPDPQALIEDTTRWATTIGGDDGR